MSMLVGVRGQTRESEGATLREGIIQQPGPFYNGNPSSIIWGNSPTTPLWREETVSPFCSTSSGFGIPKQQQQQHDLRTEEKEKDHSAAGMVTGEGRASSKGRRHVTRAQLARHQNPNPSASPSSPFAFGFPPQQPPPGSSSSSSTPGFGQSRMPPAVASSGSFVAFGSGNNFTPGAFAVGADVSGFRTGAIPSPQDERMEDIEEVLPVMAQMTMNDHPTIDSKVSAKADELTTRSGVAAQDESPAWAPSESQVAAKFSALGLNTASTAEQSMDRKDAAAAAGAGVFVFGAKPAAGKETAAEVPERPTIVQQAAPASRSRPVKVKRSAPAIKGKGIAAAGNNNDAFGAQPSPVDDLHVDGSDSASGECSFSQPTPATGLGIPEVDNAECTSDASSSQGFVSSSSMPMPVREDSAPEGAQNQNFVFGEIAKGSNSSGESSARSELSSVADTFLKASNKMGNDLSLPSAFSRVTSRKGGGVDAARSYSASSAGFSDNATSKNVSSGKPQFASGDFDAGAKSRFQFDEDLSADLALKLGLGGSHSSGKNASSADRSAVGNKSGKAFGSAEAAAGSFLRDVLAAPNLFPRDAKTGGGGVGGNQDGDGSLSSSSSPTNTAEFSRLAKESAALDGQPKPNFRSFAQAQSEPNAVHHAHRETFVFGASRSQPQPTSTGSEAAATPSPSPLLKFGATGTSSSTSPRSSSTGGGGVSRSANISAPDQFAFKHKGSSSATANDGSSTAQLQADADATPSSFSSFNLDAAKMPVKADGASNKSDGILPGIKQCMPTTVPIPSFASGANAKEDSDDNSSYVTAGSRFVFSAGSGSTSSSQATAPMAPAPKGARSVPLAEQRFKENTFPTDSTVTSDFFEAQSWSQPRKASSKSFEFQANSGSGSGGSNNNAARKKSNRTRASVPRRQSRSTATSREKKNPESFANFVDMSGTAEEAGSPMDFSPQRYTPPDDTLHETGQTAKHAAWDHSHSMEKDGLEGDDEWAQYSETDVAIENLRNAANDLTLGRKQGGRSTWEGIGKGEDESFWWGGKEKSPVKNAGRAGKWKRAVFEENQVPLSGKEYTWADIKVGGANEPESAASSSTPSADSSASSSGWGPFTFTAGSSPNFSSTTSFLRRHARRIQRDRPVPGSAEGTRNARSKVQAEPTSSGNAGMNVGLADNASSAAGGSTTMKRPVFAFESRGNPPAEAGKGKNGRAPNWEQLKVPSVMFPSRSNSWSTESSMGSLPRSDGVGGPVSPQTAGAAATEQVCERWRLRGNQAYANGDFPKAEEYYSRGASSVPPNETSQSCIRASMLCYSNRAATRMVVGRMREALADCMRAMAVDPNFLRVRLRAASCHLALGETEPAALAFKECIRRAKEDDQPDLKVSSEASEGLRKALQVEEYLDRASEILPNWSSGDTPTALRLLNEALLSSPHSERSLELKARALLILRRYDEVVQLCEQSLVTAERNHPLASGDSSIYQLVQAASGGDSVKSGAASPLKMWRLQLTAKAKFHLGRLEEALEILQKLDEMASTVAHDKASSTGTSPASDAWALSIGTIRDLLRHKAAGNDAFQNGKHAEAVEHYSAALACNGDSRPFNAVCFCNRAAASQALGNIGDAIADCSRAIALDPKYAKAISRRATLHEKVRDYSQSCHDLQRLIALLEGQQQQSRATLSPSRAGRLTTNTQQDLRQARDRLTKAEDEMKKGHPLDHYMILGLEAGCSSNEIKKAYRKAALRHHPDKAGQFVARSEGGDDGGMWKEVADEVRRDAERLFKLIGEANAILSDPQKRTRYDAEEEFRKLRTRTSTATGGFSEMYRSAERGGSAGAGRRPRDRYDSWNGYSHQHQRWQSGPDAAQPDTYARRGRYGSNNSSRSNGDGGRWNDYDWDDM